MQVAGGLCLPGNIVHQRVHDDEFTIVFANFWYIVLIANHFPVGKHNPSLRALKIYDPASRLLIDYNHRLYPDHQPAWDEMCIAYLAPDFTPWQASQCWELMVQALFNTGPGKVAAWFIPVRQSKTLLCLADQAHFSGRLRLAAPGAARFKS